MNPNLQKQLMGQVGYAGTPQSLTNNKPQTGLVTNAPIDQYTNSLKGQVQQAQAYDPNALLKAIYGSVYAPVGHAAYYNTGAAYQSALNSAKGQVDPFYNQQINAFNTSIAAQQQQANEQQQLQASGIQSQLENTLQGNEIAQGRVGEDTTNALSNMANAQQNYKQTEGMQFDIAQRGLAGQLGQAGTAESGGGQQQVQQAQTQEQLGQQAQGQQYQVQRQAQQLFANRSFQDISRSSSIAGTQAGQQKQQSELDLQKTLTGLASQQQQQVAAYQQAEKQQELAQAASNYDIGLQNFFNSQRGGNPYNLQATYQAYRPM